MSLKLPTQKPKSLKQIHVPIRLAQVEEAIEFVSADEMYDKKYTALYTFGNYQICIGKPGKEFYLERIRYKDGHLGNNPHDMSPTIIQNGNIVERNGSFEDIFKQFVKFYDNLNSLELIGCLCVRNAMCLDHRQDVFGNWRYFPPIEILNQIKQNMPDSFEEPLEVFLYYLELIALNEDTKYHTLGYNIKTGIGRFNNLMTYANVIHIILHRKNDSEAEFLLEFMKFVGGLVRPPVGLNPISLRKALNAFPLLNP
jgi:hypothetical protein